MIFFNDTIDVCTQAPIELVDVTNEIRTLLSLHPVDQGQVLLCSSHTTAFVAINERESKLQQDMVAFLERLVPANADYGHNIDTIDGRLNAHSHLLGLFMRASETIPVIDGQLLLGTWQSVFLVELDGPRDLRHLQVQISGVRSQDD